MKAEHRRFCVLVALEGFEPVEAAKMALYDEPGKDRPKPESIIRITRKIMADPHIQQRLTELRETSARMMAERAAIAKQKAFERESYEITADVRQALESLEMSIIPLVPTKEWVMSQLVLNHLKASAAVPVLDKEGNPTGVYQANLPASNAALNMIGTEIGMFVKRSVVESKQVKEMSEEDLHKAIAKAAQEAGMTIMGIEADQRH